MILKRELLYPKLNESSPDRQKTTARIISLLGVNFQDESERNLAITEFGTFLRSYSLTSQEVIEAYKMAIRKEFDYKVYPTLSVIQCGEILNLYMEFKRNDLNRSRAIDHLTKMNEEKKGLTAEEVAEIDLEFNKTVFAEIQEKGFSDMAFVFYRSLNESNKLRNWDAPTKRRFLNYVQGKYIEWKKKQSITDMKAFRDVKVIIQRADKTLPEVVKLCQSIFASNYIRKFKSFEEFQKNQ